MPRNCNFLHNPFAVPKATSKLCKSLGSVPEKDCHNLAIAVYELSGPLIISHAKPHGSKEVEPEVDIHVIG